MGTLVFFIFIWACLTEINRHFEKKKFQKLERQVQHLGHIIQRRQTGQSWEQIRQDDEELGLIRRYMGIDD